MLEARGLNCARGDRLLFSNVSFSLAPGEMLHVRGANGSGKTSLLRLLCGLLLPDAGEISWDGENIRHCREQYHAALTYLGHHGGVKDDLNPVENLDFSAGLHGIHSETGADRQALGAVGLTRCSVLPTRVLSQGQKRRVALARLWQENRTLWILDEPFAALDVAAIEVLAEHVSAHLECGGMAVMTTHQEVPLRARSVQELKLGR